MATDKTKKSIFIALDNSAINYLAEATPLFFSTKKADLKVLTAENFINLGPSFDSLARRNGREDVEAIGRSCMAILNRVHNVKDIKLLITPVGIEEACGTAYVPRRKVLESFIFGNKNKIYVPNTNIIFADKFNSEAYDLAQKYMQPYDSPMSQSQRPAPMDRKPFSYKHLTNDPPRDVWAMAEASIRMACLFEFNRFDFNSYKSPDNPFRRDDGIRELNILNGYCETQPGGKIVAPVPIYPPDFVNELWNETRPLGLVTSPDYTKTPANTQVDFLENGDELSL